MKIISAKNHILYAFKWVKIRVKTSRNVHQDDAKKKRGAVLIPLPVFYQNQLNNSTIERLNNIFIP